ncbi:MAG: carbon starvation CstA family protein, partial [Chitinivibrionales bacterium]
MSSIILTMTSVVLLGLGYYVYSPFVEKWLGLDKSAIPPSEEMYDGDDYVPAKHWVILLGHHFASIAGAAPIIGPVVACLIWGWGPALIWLVIGGVVFGGVHDLASLHLSLEFKGKSITSVT